MGSYQIGKASELRAAAWLISNGWEVYQGFNGTFDFIAWKKEHGYLTVEVKTSAKLQEFPLMWKYRPNILILVNHEGKIKALTKTLSGGTL